MPEEFPKKIAEAISLPLTLDKFGLYAISITARCGALSSGEDLRVEIDDMRFREVPSNGKLQLFNIPPAWNGAQLKGLAKTVVYILKLDRGEHFLTFVPTNGAIIDGYKVEWIENTKAVSFSLEAKAEDVDRRPWYTFALIDLPLEAVAADVSVGWHLWDGDDVKLIVDNKAEENTKSKLWKYWVWHASPKQILTGLKREQKMFVKEFSQGVHYVEFWADKTPTLHTVSFDLGEVELKHIPTEGDPESTGDFNDDTDVMILARLILGEMEGQVWEARLGAGFTVINRIQKANPNWGLSLKEIVLKEGQYDAFWNENTIDKVRNPLSRVSEEEWKTCYKAAMRVLSGMQSDPTSGATHFYSTDTDTGFPLWATDDVFKVKIGTTYFYELEN